MCVGWLTHVQCRGFASRNDFSWFSLRVTSRVHLRMQLKTGSNSWREKKGCLRSVEKCAFLIWSREFVCHRNARKHKTSSFFATDSTRRKHRRATHLLACTLFVICFISVLNSLLILTLSSGNLRGLIHSVLVFLFTTLRHSPTFRRINRATKMTSSYTHTFFQISLAPILFINLVAW